MANSYDELLGLELRLEQSCELLLPRERCTHSLCGSHYNIIFLARVQTQRHTDALALHCVPYRAAHELREVSLVSRQLGRRILI